MVNNHLKQSLSMDAFGDCRLNPVGHQSQSSRIRRNSALLSPIFCSNRRAIVALFCPAWPMMLEPACQDDLPKVLARSFIRAWECYYLSDRSNKVLEEVARPSLAKHLVGMANEGVQEEAALVAGGLQHLISLGGDASAWREFPPAVANAKFLHQWKIRLPFRFASR